MKMANRIHNAGASVRLVHARLQIGHMLGSATLKRVCNVATGGL